MLKNCLINIAMILFDSFKISLINFLTLSDYNYLIFYYRKFDIKNIYDVILMRDKYNQNFNFLFASFLILRNFAFFNINFVI